MLEGKQYVKNENNGDWLWSVLIIVVSVVTVLPGLLR